MVKVSSLVELMLCFSAFFSFNYEHLEYHLMSRLQNQLLSAVM
jgi:hypothetical protein